MLLVLLAPLGVVVGAGPAGPAVGVEVEGPVGVVCESVVVSAEAAHAVGVGGAAVCPVVCVVGVCPGRW